MSKYDILGKYLEKSNKDEITLTYKEIETILGFCLPSSAYKYYVFWGKGITHVRRNAVEKHGYKPTKRDNKKEFVTFSKINYL